MLKKKNISSRKRKAAVMISVMVSAALCLLTVIFGFIGIDIDKTVTKASYNTVSEINYDMIFEENPVYNESSLEFGTGYVAKYVDAIDLGFAYDFLSDTAFEMSGSYTVDAVLEANYNSTYLIWKKEYSLVPKTNFTSEHVSEHLTLPLKEYGETAESIEWDTGVTTSATMTVYFTVSSSAVIDGSPVTDESVSTLTFDLSQDVLIMSGEPKKEQSGNVEGVIPTALISKNSALKLGIPLWLLSVGAIVYLLVFTSGVIEDPIRTGLLRLYKRYGSRIAELYPGTNISSHVPIMVRSFRDLLLTADELKKPIFTNSAAEYRDVEFYVIDDTKIYIFSATSLKENSKLKTNIAAAFAGNA